MTTTLNDPAVAYSLAYADGRSEALDFRADHTEEECAEAAEEAVGPDEALISAMGPDWLARRWGIDWDTQGLRACAEYNRGYRVTLRELV